MICCCNGRHTGSHRDGRSFKNREIDFSSACNVVLNDWRESWRWLSSGGLRETFWRFSEVLASKSREEPYSSRFRASSVGGCVERESESWRSWSLDSLKDTGSELGVRLGLNSGCDLRSYRTCSSVGELGL
jgi:hypothetical protein